MIEPWLCNLVVCLSKSQNICRFPNATIYLYIGFVASTLNQRMRKTSSQPEKELTSQSSTVVVPRRTPTREVDTASIILNYQNKLFIKADTCFFFFNLSVLLHAEYILYWALAQFSLLLQLRLSSGLLNKVFSNLLKYVTLICIDCELLECLNLVLCINISTSRPNTLYLFKLGYYA